MAQYREGTVEVTNGSVLVTAVDPDPTDAALDSPAQWLSEVSPGDWFVVVGDGGIYTVASVISDTALNLTSAYTGTTVSAPGPAPYRGVSYAIVRDFSDNYGFPLMEQGDFETVSIMRQALIMMDAQLKALDDRLTAQGV